MIGISICTDTFKKVPLDWSVLKFIWTKFAMCASFVRNLFLQSSNKSGDLYRRKIGNEWRHGETESHRNFVTALKVNAEWSGNALVRCTYFWPPRTTQHAQPCTKSSVQQMLTRRHDYSSRNSCHGGVLYVHKKDKLSASLWVNSNAVWNVKTVTTHSTCHLIILKLLWNDDVAISGCNIGSKTLLAEHGKLPLKFTCPRWHFHLSHNPV